MADTEITQERLQNAALKITDNFCYSCYKVVKGSQCPICGSDDFMRHLSGVGVEYGTEWVIEHLFKTRLTPVDGEKMYEELLDECYPEIKIGCCTLSTSQVLKELDPICFDTGAKENLDSLAQDGQLYEHGGEYYNVDDINTMLEEIEAE